MKERVSKGGNYTRSLNMTHIQEQESKEGDCKDREEKILKNNVRKF